MSRHLITEEDKKPEILLEQDDGKNVDASETKASDKEEDQKPSLKIAIKAKPKAEVRAESSEEGNPSKKLKTKSLVDYSDSEDN